MLQLSTRHLGLKSSDISNSANSRTEEEKNDK